MVKPSYTIPARDVWRVECGRGAVVELRAMAPYPPNQHTIRAAAAGDAFAATRLKEAPWLRGSPQTFVQADYSKASERILDRLVSKHPTRLIDGRQSYMTFAGTVDDTVKAIRGRSKACRVVRGRR